MSGCCFFIFLNIILVGATYKSPGIPPHPTAPLKRGIYRNALYEKLPSWGVGNFVGRGGMLNKMRYISRQNKVLLIYWWSSESVSHDTIYPTPRHLSRWRWNLCDLLWPQKNVRRRNWRSPRRYLRPQQPACPVHQSPWGVTLLHQFYPPQPPIRSGAFFIQSVLVLEVQMLQATERSPLREQKYIQPVKQNLSFQII